MAREHARILTSIWSDPDFRLRSPEAQRLYVLVLSQSSVNNAGVVPLQPKKWASGSVATTAEDLEKPLRELHDHGYVIVDDNADEALIRSFIRNDGVWRQPNVLKNALRQARATFSPVLRAALSHELVRVSRMLPDGKGYEGIPEELRRTVAQLSPEGSHDPFSNPSGDGSLDPLSDPPLNPSRSRGVGEGVGDGAGPSPSRDGWVGGSRARTTPARPAAASASGGPPPLPSELEEEPRPAASAAPPAATWPVQPCGDRHDPERPCRRCGAARRSGQDQADQAVLAEAARRAAEAERSRQCPMCVNGWLEHPETRDPVVKCDHQTDPRKQIADALDQAS